MYGLHRWAEYVIVQLQALTPLGMTDVKYGLHHILTITYHVYVIRINESYHFIISTIILLLLKMKQTRIHETSMT